jgi:hypothetical protein
VRGWRRRRELEQRLLDCDGVRDAWGLQHEPEHRLQYLRLAELRAAGRECTVIEGLSDEEEKAVIARVEQIPRALVPLAASRQVQVRFSDAGVMNGRHKTALYLALDPPETPEEKKRIGEVMVALNKSLGGSPVIWPGEA